MESTCLSGGLPANPSVLPDSEKDSRTPEETLCLFFLDLLTGSGPDGWSGKTCPVFFPPGQVLTRRVIWRKESNGKLTKRVISPASSPVLRNSGMGGRGLFLTLSTSEFRNGAVVSSLSDILETGSVPQRFFLSAKACAGILRRAAKRGKKLPPQLEAALRMVARDTEAEPGTKTS